MADDDRKPNVTGDLSDNPLPTDDIVNERKGSEDGATDRPPVLEEMLHRTSRAKDWWDKNHHAARDDVDFAYNEQWPHGTRADRGNRPALTLNLLPQYIHQVLGQAKGSKFNIHIIQTAGPNDKIPLWVGGGKATMYPPAEVMEGLIRDIERRSNADRAYVRALQHAVESGFGWLWVRTTRPFDNPFETEIRIEHRKDRWSVMMDPGAEQDDFSDAKWGIVTENMNIREFRSRWPDVETGGFGLGGGFDDEYSRWWRGESEVRVAHYYYKEAMKRTAVRFVHLDGTEILGYEDEFEPVLDDIEAMGFEETGRQEVNSYKVKHILCTSNQILDGPNDWPGMRIPMVPVLGREINLDGYNHYAGITRWAMDPQRMYNYFASSAIERVALSPKAPWLATAGQIAGFENDWKDQHLRNISLLMYNHDVAPDGTVAPPPMRQEPATMPAAEMQVVLHMRQAVQETIGIYEASLGKKSNETSGVAIERRQAQGHAGVMDFIDNLSYSISSLGDLLCDIIPKVYSGNAMRRIIMPDDTQARVQLNHEVTDNETGRKFKVGNLSLYRYTCGVKTGPAFDSVREEFVTMMTEWGRSDPDAIQAVRDLVVSNLDIPNSREIARRFKLLAPRWLLRPEDQENLPEPPQPPPTPEQEAEMAKAEAAQVKAQSDIQIAQLKIQEAQVQLQIEQARLEVAKEKGAAEITKSEQQDEGKDDKKMEAVAKRVMAQSNANKR